MLPILEQKRDNLIARRAKNAAKTIAARQRFFEATPITPTDNYDALVKSGELLPLDESDKIVYSYSGGKDSLAGLLQLLERCERLSIPKSKLEVWHQHVDGDPERKDGLMDWPCTETYCRATAKALDLTLRFQWRIGGIERELIRENETVQGVCYENEYGDVISLRPNPPAKQCSAKVSPMTGKPLTDEEKEAEVEPVKCGHKYPHKGIFECPKCGSRRGNIGTKFMWPMVTPDLKRRWCSAIAKIDVARRTISNDPRFAEGNFLMLTGERREESANRSKYDEVVPYNKTQKRRVDQWRNVLDWNENQVWDIIRRWKIDPHPAYKLGWGRVSCMCCIYGDEDQWASINELDSARFNRVADYEVQFESTISTRNEKGKNVSYSVREQQSIGKSFVVDAPAEIVEQAMGQGYNVDNVFVTDWVLPKGAFARCRGPE